MINSYCLRKTVSMLGERSVPIKDITFTVKALYWVKANLKDSYGFRQNTNLLNAFNWDIHGGYNFWRNIQRDLIVRRDFWEGEEL